MKHARNYVKRRRAEWVKVNEIIRFLPTPQHKAVIKSARKPVVYGNHYEASSDVLAKPYQLRGTGCVGDIDSAYHLGVLGAWAWTVAVNNLPNQSANNHGTQKRGVA